MRVRKGNYWHDYNSQLKWHFCLFSREFIVERGADEWILLINTFELRKRKFMLESLKSNYFSDSFFKIQFNSPFNSNEMNLSLTDLFIIDLTTNSTVRSIHEKIPKICNSPQFLKEYESVFNSIFFFKEAFKWDRLDK